MNLWLKSLNRYSVSQINTYPTVTNAITIVTSVLRLDERPVPDPVPDRLLLADGPFLCGDESRHLGWGAVWAEMGELLSYWVC